MRVKPKMGPSLHVCRRRTKKSHPLVAQLALRFPGDACPGNTAKSNDAHFNNIASHWHIDGCASDFIKGVTDHYGEVRTR